MKSAFLPPWRRICILLAGLLFVSCEEIPFLRIPIEKDSPSTAFYRWSKTLGIYIEDASTLLDSANAIACDEDGNVYYVGVFSVFADFDGSDTKRDYRKTNATDKPDGFLSSVDKDGNYRWTATTNGYAIPVGIAVDSSSSGIPNIYVVGVFKGSMTFAGKDYISSTSGGADYYDVFIAKYKQDGSYCWVKTLGGTSDDMPIGVRTDGQGNVYIVGHFSSPSVDFDPAADSFATTVIAKSSGSSYDPFVLKLDSDGDYVWAIHFPSDHGTAVFGYSMGFICTDLAVDVQGNIYIVGGFAATKNFNPSGEFAYSLTARANSINMFVLKLDSEKAFVWARQYGDLYPCFATSVALSENNILYVTGLTGTYQSYGEPNRLMITKLDTEGVLLWDSWKTCGTPHVSGAEPATTEIERLASRPQVVLDSKGYILVAGRFANGSMSFDPEGDTVDAAHTYSYKGGWDSYLVRFRPNGLFDWVKTLGGTGDDSKYGLAIDDEDSLYLAGRYSSDDLDFNIDLTEEDHTEAIVKAIGENDAFIAKYSPRD